MITISLGELGFTLIIIGFILVFLSVIIMMIFAVKGGGEVKGGGAVLIGPFPLIFGSKEFIKYSFILLIIMVIFALILMIIPFMLTNYPHLATIVILP